MKKSLFSAMFSAVALIALQATAAPISPIHGPLTIEWTINQQNLDHVPKYAGNGKTSVSGAGASKATNVLQIYQYSFTTTPFKNTSFLHLLENSLNTNFPTGTKLATDGASVYVTDSTGTNSIVDITPVLTVTSTNGVISGLDTTTQTYKKSGTSATDLGTSSGNQVIILNYDDSALTTADGTFTTFTFLGVSAFTRSGSSKTSTNGVVTGSESGSFTIKGNGYGNIRGTGSIIEGTILGSPSGTYSENIGDL